MKEKKKSNKRVFLGAASIFLALLLTFIISPVYQKASEAKCSVVRVTKDIAQGKQITFADIEVVTVGSFNMAKEVYKSPDEVLNLYATADLKKGDYIVQGKVSETPTSFNAYLWELDGKKQAISISIPSFAAGLSGKLEAGDIISIATIRELENGEREAVIPIELNYVEVLAVTASNGFDVDAQIIAKDGEKEELPATITVLVSEEQVLRLAQLEDKNSIHVALVYRGEERNRYLDLQTKMITKMKEIDKDIKTEAIKKEEER